MDMQQASITPSTKTNMRRFARVNCTLPIALTLGPNAFWHTQSVNISEGGLLMAPLAADIELKPGDKLRILIDGILTDSGLYDPKIGDYFNVRVVYIEPQGIGLEFLQAGP